MSGPLTPILLIVWKLLVGQMELSQPQPSGIYPPPQDKPRRFFEERADMNHHYHCDTTLLAAGGYGGSRIYQDSATKCTSHGCQHRNAQYEPKFFQRSE